MRSKGLGRIGKTLRDAACSNTPTGVHASLPSSDAAKAFLEHAPGGTIKLVSSTLLRSLLILPGLLAVKIDPKKAMAGAAIASLGITTFILIYLSVSKPMPKTAEMALQGRSPRPRPPRRPHAPRELPDDPRPLPGRRNRYERAKPLPGLAALRPR